MRAVCAGVGLCFVLLCEVQGELTHRYTFSNNVNDVTGNLNGVATLANTYTETPLYSTNIPAGTASGAPGKSLLIGMNTESVKSGFTLPVGVISQPQGTLCFWVNADKLDSTDYIFYGSPLAPSIYVKGAGTTVIQLGAGGGASTATTMSTGVWHHVAVTWDNGVNNAQLYLDGILARTIAGYPNDVAPTVFSVGGYSLANNNTVLANQFKGFLYDLQFYDTVLTGENVSSLFASPGDLLRKTASIKLIVIH